MINGIQGGDARGHKGLMRLRKSLQHGGDKGDADAAADVAHQVLDAGGVADLIIAQRRQADGGQRHKNETRAKAAEQIGGNMLLWAICRETG